MNPVVINPRLTVDKRLRSVLFLQEIFLIIFGRACGKFSN